MPCRNRGRGDSTSSGPLFHQTSIYTDGGVLREREEKHRIEVSLENNQNSAKKA